MIPLSVHGIAALARSSSVMQLRVSPMSLDYSVTDLPGLYPHAT